MPDPAVSLIDEAPHPACPDRFNIAAHVLAAGRPDKVALTVTGEGARVLERWTYADLDRAIRGTAAGLRAQGLGPGERVALRLGNTAAFPVLFFATIAAGGVAVPTAAALTAPEFRVLLEDMAPRLVCVADDLALDTPGIAQLHEADWTALAGHPPGEIADTAAEDPAFLVYTSGTSGRPKGVLHAQRSALARRMMWQGWYGLRPDDTVLHAGAFNWTYTLGTGLTDPWAIGATTLIHTGPRDPLIWARLAAEHGPTLFAAVPGVYRQLLRAEGLGQAFSGLRHGLSAGERLPEPVAEGWRKATGKPVFEALGMSEISTYVSSAPDVPRRPGTSGRPQKGRRVAVVDDGGHPVPRGEPGTLAVSHRDPGLMLGYRGRPEATARAFRGEWFLTGDLARMDADGYVTHLGRADEVMTSLGYRVAPAEVEAALASHPGLAEVAVAELPVRADLSLIAAFAVPRGPWPGEAALAAHAAERLAEYKRPRLFIQVDSLPVTPNGKLVRRRLIEAHRRDR